MHFLAKKVGLQRVCVNNTWVLGKTKILDGPMTQGLVDPDLKDISFIAKTYQILGKAGEGTFSTVYKAKSINREKDENPVAIKAITKTSSPGRVVEELRFLKKLGGNNNVIKIVDCFRFEDQICVAFPYIEAIDFRTFLKECSLRDVKLYLYNLLIAVSHVHKNSIIHRDIKPSNFLYSQAKRQGVLIDFGLAQYEKETKKKSPILEEVSGNKRPSVLFFNSILSKIAQPPGYYVGDSRPQMRAQRAGTRGFRAPEVLFRSSRQNRSIDIWSVGVSFLVMCTKQYPFFNSIDDTDAIVEIATIFGHEEMRKAAKNYERVWRSNLSTIPNERIPFEKIVSSLNPEFNLPSEGYDLLYRMLDLVSENRISAEESLEHPFFNDIQ